MASEFATLIGPVAQTLLGEPNRGLSSAVELRWGERGSFSVDLAKGTWFDFEANEGGGTLDLVSRETKLTGPERLEWLRSKGFIYDTVRTNGAHHPNEPRSRIVATYDYTDEGGALLFQVCRFEPKDFRQRRPNGHGDWDWSVKGIKPVPYRLPGLIEAGDRIVCIVEGEKDCDRLAALGIPATCNAGGAGKWRAELNEFFRGADVVIIPDRDPPKRHPKTGEPMIYPDGRPMLPGQDHAQTVAASLHDVARRVRVLELWNFWPDMPLKGDVSDWIANGGTANQLYDIIDRVPDWAPAAPASEIKTVPLLYPFPIDGASIPRRQWIVGGLLLRKNLTILVAPPGSGKSLLTLQLALMMASAMPWGGWRPRGTFKILVINAEDDADEMRRRLYAASIEMKIDGTMVRERVAIAENPADIVIAKADSRTKTVVAEPMYDRLVKTVRDNQIDCLVVDPFAETFVGDENSNSELKWAAVLWRRVARETDSAVMLVHHTRKYANEAGDMDTARGGGSLVGVARVVSTLFGMKEEEAAQYNIPVEDRHVYLRFDDAKANLSLVTFNAKWFRKKTIELPNGSDDEAADEVGVLVPWQAPQGIFARMPMEVVDKILDTIAAGHGDDRYSFTRRGEGNKRWAGDLIMGLIKCNPKEAQFVLKTWLESGVISEISAETSTSKGKLRKGLVVNETMRPGKIISHDEL